jgi:hypothetical protein
VPAFTGFPDQFDQGQAIALGPQVSQETSRDEKSRESVHIGMFFDQLPIEPSEFVVVAIGIVIALLRAPDLVAHQYHGHPHREYGGGKKILNLPVSKFLYCSVIGRPFDAPVAAAVVVFTIAAFLAIRLVVFFR